MISRIQVLHYRALKYIDVNLSGFQILVGPNASGKSTFLDVIELVKDILNENPQAAVERRASHFRELLWKQRGDTFEIAIELKIPDDFKVKLSSRDYSKVRYEVSLQSDNKKGIVIPGESLYLMKKNSQKETTISNRNNMQRTLFPMEPPEPAYLVSARKRTPVGWRKVVSKSDQGNDYFRSETTDWNIVYKFGPSKASLARMPEDEKRFPVALLIKSILMDGIRFLQLDSSAMKWPCRPDLPVSFQADGSNLPKVVQYLQREKPDAFSRWIKHLQTALPEIADIDVKEKVEDRFLYLNIKHINGLNLPSWVISDGTLRLFAQTLIAYLPEKYRVYMIEEPENGLHPLAIESIFQSLSSVYDNQIMLATHSPAILRLAKPEEILCFSKSESGAVDIVRGEEHPRLKDWRRDVDLATLHAAGVLQ